MLLGAMAGMQLGGCAAMSVAGPWLPCGTHRRHGQAGPRCA